MADGPGGERVTVRDSGARAAACRRTRRDGTDPESLAGTLTGPTSAPFPDGKSRSPAVTTHPSLQLDDMAASPGHEEQEKRRQAFQELVRGIPRLCSPSLVACSTPMCDTSPRSFDPDFKFDWSIDQIATLQPVDFSTELNASFYQLDESVAEAIRDENGQFFNQSRVLPSPDTSDTGARDGFDSFLSPRGVSMSVEMLGTPSRGFGDMSVSEAKLPTPLNVSKTRQKKKKLFADDSLISDVLTVSSFSQSHSPMQCCHSDSLTATQAAAPTMPEMSPIVGEVTRVLEMGVVDETFASESGSAMTSASSVKAGTRLFSMHSFAFHTTSTPTASHS